jgi:hypothetical protein
MHLRNTFSPDRPDPLHHPRVLLADRSRRGRVHRRLPAVRAPARRRSLVPEASAHVALHDLAGKRGGQEPILRL